MLFFTRKPDQTTNPEASKETAAPEAAPSPDSAPGEAEEPEEKFFSVRYSARAVITPFSDSESIPSEADFLREIPELFNIAAPCAPSDLVRFRRMVMTTGDTGRLASFLLSQAERINGLTRYILDEASKDAAETETISAGGFIIRKHYPLNTLARVSVFLPEYGTAAYAIARAEKPGDAEKALLTDDGQFTFFRFIIIRDQDRAAIQAAVAEIERKSLRERKKSAAENSQTERGQQ